MLNKNEYPKFHPKEKSHLQDNNNNNNKKPILLQRYFILTGQRQMYTLKPAQTFMFLFKKNEEIRMRGDILFRSVHVSVKP